MKITGPLGQTLGKAAGELRVGEAAKAQAGTAGAPAVPGGHAAAGAGLESALLQPAKAALDALPEVDAAAVDALRQALARGEIAFDANRLARLIQRFHGGGQGA